MHSTSIWPSHSERRSGLPCMRWPLQRLRLWRQWLQVVLVPVLLLVEEQRRRSSRGGPAAAQGHAGREPVRPLLTRLPKCGRSRQSAKASRSERPCPTFGTSFSAMRGTTGRGSPRSCTICLSHAVSRSGSARMTLASAIRCSALSTRAWRSREIGIVLVTPALLRRLQAEGVADKELSALLARDQLVPIVHEHDV